MASKKAGETGKHPMEFGGPLGAAGMVLGLPLGVIVINLLCNKETCSIHIPDIGLDFRSAFDLEMAFIVVAWFLFQVCLHLLPVGQVAQGLPLVTGERLKYRCNAFIAFLISMAAFVGLIYSGYDVTLVYRKYTSLMTMAIIFSFVLSIFLYIKSIGIPGHKQAAGGNSGIFIYDFFMGRELNPRLGGFDLKFFCELRPGLIGWVMLDLVFVAQAHNWYGHVPPALVLVTFFHAFYVADALWNEEAILTTMDIVHDGFGFMLAFGDLAWVPFLYNLQAKFLLEHSQDWGVVGLTAIFLLNLLGYAIFRGANSQKNDFRKNPDDPKLAHLETLTTSTGRKLLVSGWWAISRHPNYLGDLIMALSWSLPCGMNLIPYFYPIYFLGLLVHRFERDEINCRKKYGADWTEYCHRVPYKIIPYIY